MAKRVIQGTIVGDAMDKTVVVSVERRKKHRLYHKVITATKRYKAHDEENTCRLGDVVNIIESAPFSKGKHWRVIEVLSRGDVAEISPEVIGREIEETAGAVVDDETPSEGHEDSAEAAAGEGNADEPLASTEETSPDAEEQK